MIANIYIGNIATAGGTVNAITAAYVPAPTVLVDKMILYFRATGANTTTTPTFSPNSLTARTIVKQGGQALVAGDIPGSGAIMEMVYDSANTRWELLNPANPSSSSLGYNVYTALLSQSGTSAPTATVLKNTLGGNVTYGYTGAGEFTANSAGLFTLNKTTCEIAPCAPAFFFAEVFNATTSQIAILSTDATTLTNANDLFQLTKIEIRVYP